MHAMQASRRSLLDALGRFIRAAISHSTGAEVSSRQRGGSLHRYDGG